MFDCLFDFIMKTIQCVFLGIWVLLVPVFGGGVKTGDTLGITIKGVPVDEQAQVNGDYRVGESGKIKVPITGTMISVVGLTNEQISRKVEKVFKDGKVYQEPVIETIVKGVDDPNRESLTVGGQVKRPGAVMWKRGLTLQQVIQMAGDRTPFGSKYVYLTRNGKKYMYNTSKVAHQNLKIYPNDTVEVKQVGPFGDR